MPPLPGCYSPLPFYFIVYTHTHKKVFLFSRLLKKKNFFFYSLEQLISLRGFWRDKKKRNLSLRFLHPMRRGGQCWMPFTHTKKKKREKRFCARNLITKVWHDPRYLYINRIVFFSLPTDFFFFSVLSFVLIVGREYITDHHRRPLPHYITLSSCNYRNDEYIGGRRRHFLPI